MALPKLIVKRTLLGWRLPGLACWLPLGPECAGSRKGRPGLYIQLPASQTSPRQQRPGQPGGGAAGFGRQRDCLGGCPPACPKAYPTEGACSLCKARPQRCLDVEPHHGNVRHTWFSVIVCGLRLQYTVCQLFARLPGPVCALQLGGRAIACSNIKIPISLSYHNTCGDRFGPFFHDAITLTAGSFAIIGRQIGGAACAMSSTKNHRTRTVWNRL